MYFKNRDLGSSNWSASTMIQDWSDPNNFDLSSTANGNIHTCFDYGTALRHKEWNGSWTSYYEFGSGDAAQICGNGNDLYFLWIDNTEDELRLRQKDYSPIIPQNLSIDETGNYPVLGWTRNNEADLDHYNIYRKITTNDRYGTVIEDWTKKGESGTASYTDFTFGLQENGSYKAYYKIKAEDAFENQSDFSGSVSTEGIIQMKPLSGSERIPEKFVLHANYPNPFNPTTKIKFDLPEDSFTKLSVYDIKGALVQILVNNHLNSGQYEVAFNAANLPSGVFLQIYSGKFFIHKTNGAP